MERRGRAAVGGEDGTHSKVASACDKMEDGRQGNDQNREACVCGAPEQVEDDLVFV